MTGDVAADPVAADPVAAGDDTGGAGRSDAGEGPHPGRVLSDLAATDRLRVFAALVLDGPLTTDDVMRRTGLGAPAVRSALVRLSGGGLVDGAPDDSWAARPDTVARAARAASRLRLESDPTELGATEEQARVLRRFMAGGRLRTIPVQLGKRRVLLDFLAQQFEPGRTYPEAAVNDLLDRWHPDHAALRRYLVDEQFLERRGGFYWRSGGTFEV